MYTFAINSTLNNLDPNVTLGLFTWDAQAGDQNNREMDIEFGRWATRMQQPMPSMSCSHITALTTSRSSS